MDNLLEVRQAELRRHISSTLNLKKVPFLKQMCRSRDLRVGGRKAEVVERLVLDVLKRGWTVTADSDLWKNYSTIPESPADSKKSKTATCYDKPSISNLDDSDSGRSSPPSSVSGSPSSSLASIADDSSVGSSASGGRPADDDYAFGGDENDVSPSVSPSVSPTSGESVSDGSSSPKVARKKRVALFVDTESPEKKRKKNLSGMSADSGVYAAPRRPHQTRRALKAGLRKTSRRSGTDLLSRDNAGAVVDTIKDYALSDHQYLEENPRNPEENQRNLEDNPIAATSFRTFLSPFLAGGGGGDGSSGGGGSGSDCIASGPRGVAGEEDASQICACDASTDVVPISLVSCEALRRSVDDDDGNNNNKKNNSAFSAVVPISLVSCEALRRGKANGNNNNNNNHNNHNNNNNNNNGISDIVPISLVSRQALRWGEDALFLSTYPSASGSRATSSDFKEASVSVSDSHTASTPDGVSDANLTSNVVSVSDPDSSSGAVLVPAANSTSEAVSAPESPSPSTSVVATLTAAGVPVAIVTTDTLPPFDSAEDELDGESGEASAAPAVPAVALVPAARVTPAIEWIRVTEEASPGSARENSTGRAQKRGR